MILTIGRCAECYAAYKAEVDATGSSAIVYSFDLGDGSTVEGSLAVAHLRDQYEIAVPHCILMRSIWVEDLPEE